MSLEIKHIYMSSFGAFFPFALVEKNSHGAWDGPNMASHLWRGRAQ
jgi:hypothetical protein